MKRDSRQSQTAQTAAPERTLPKPVDATARRTRRTVILLGVTAAALVVSSITLWAIAREERPRLSADTESIVKYVASRDYRRLPFGQRVGYMQVLESRDDNDELKDLFNAGKISEAEYRAAMDEAWLGQQYKRTQKFADLPPGAPRESYVRELVDKKFEKDARKAAKAASGKARKDEPSDAVKRDEASEEALVAEWPADMRTKWADFRAAYRAEKEAREQAEARPKPASAKPAG